MKALHTGRKSNTLFVTKAGVRRCITCDISIHNNFYYFFILKFYLHQNYTFLPFILKRKLYFLFFLKSQVSVISHNDNTNLSQLKTAQKKEKNQSFSLWFSSHQAKDLNLRQSPPTPTIKNLLLLGQKDNFSCYFMLLSFVKLLKRTKTKAHLLDYFNNCLF